MAGAWGRPRGPPFPPARRAPGQPARPVPTQARHAPTAATTLLLSLLCLAALAPAARAQQAALGWTELADGAGAATGTAPLPRCGHVSVLLSASDGGNTALLFGGVTHFGNPLQFFLLRDTWAFAVATSAWSRVIPTNLAPNERSHLTATEMPAATSTSAPAVVFLGGICTLAAAAPVAGTPCPASDFVWTYTYSTHTWDQPAIGGAAPPAPRWGHVAARDGNSIWLFGGTGGAGLAADAAGMNTLYQLDWANRVWSAYTTTVATSTFPAGFAWRPRWGAIAAIDGILVSFGSGRLLVSGGVVGDVSTPAQQMVTNEVLAITVAAAAAAGGNGTAAAAAAGVATVRAVTDATGQFSMPPRAFAAGALYSVFSGAGAGTYLITALGYGRALLTDGYDADQASVLSMKISAAGAPWSLVLPLGPSAPLAPRQQPSGFLAGTNLALHGGRACVSAGASGNLGGPAPTCTSSTTTVATMADTWSLDLRAASVGRGQVSLTLAAGGLTIVMDRLIVYSPDPSGSGGFLQAQRLSNVVPPLNVTNVPAGTAYVVAFDANGAVRGAVSGAVPVAGTLAALIALAMPVPVTVTIVREDGFTPLPGVLVTLDLFDTDARAWRYAYASGTTDTSGGTTFLAVPNVWPLEPTVASLRPVYQLSFGGVSPALNVTVQPVGGAAGPAALVPGTPFLVQAGRATLGPRGALGTPGTAAASLLSGQTSYFDVSVALTAASAGGYVTLSASSAQTSATLALNAALSGSTLYPGPATAGAWHSTGTGAATLSIRVPDLLIALGLSTGALAGGQSVAVTLAVGLVATAASSGAVTVPYTLSTALATAAPAQAAAAAAGPAVLAAAAAAVGVSPAALGAGLGVGLGGGLLLLAAAGYVLWRRHHANRVEAVLLQSQAAARAAEVAANKAEREAAGGKGAGRSPAERSEAAQREQSLAALRRMDTSVLTLKVAQHLKKARAAADQPPAAPLSAADKIALSRGLKPGSDAAKVSVARSNLAAGGHAHHNAQHQTAELAPHLLKAVGGEGSGNLGGPVAGAGEAALLLLGAGAEAAGAGGPPPVQASRKNPRSIIGMIGSRRNVGSEPGSPMSSFRNDPAAGAASPPRALGSPTASASNLAAGVGSSGEVRARAFGPGSGSRLGGGANAVRSASPPPPAAPRRPPAALPPVIGADLADVPRLPALSSHLDPARLPQPAPRVMDSQIDAAMERLRSRG